MPAAITTKKRRLYYLHRRIKPFLKVDAKTKQIFITEELVQALTPQATNYFGELKQIYHYSAQYIIPNQ